MKSKIDIDNKIDAYIKENENGDITATQLNEILKEINAALFEFMDTYLSTSFPSLGGESVITKFSKLTEQLTGITNRVTALENGGGETPDVPTEDTIELSGSFSYQKVQNLMCQSYPSTYLTPLVLKKNGVAQSVTFKYVIDECDFATIDINTGVISFSRNNGSTQRSVDVKIYCFFEGKEYFKLTTAVQDTAQATPAETVELTGTFSYSGNVAASGGTKTPTNTLGITKNGVAISGVTITYSSNQSYATVDSTGKVTFASHTNTSTRTATITATVTDGTHTYTKTATVTQSAYVAPTETLTYYADIKTLSAGGSAGISDVTSPSSYTNGTFNYTVPAKGNTIILLCPSSKSLQSCIKQGEILDNITAELNSSVTNVTYNSKSYKMYQFRYAANIQGEKFEIKFN